MLSMYDFYMEEIQSQAAAVDWMISGGMHIDVPALIALRKKLRAEIGDLNSQIEAEIGWVPNTKSPIDMGKLFTLLGVIPQLTKKTKKAKIGKEDLYGYTHRFPNSRSILSRCLDITARRTIQSNFLSMALDTEDYYHPVYLLNGTKSGRFASHGADEGGPQGQNWPSSLLHIVIPDDPDRDELIEADLVQAEDMIIAYDANDRVMIQAFEQGVDSHRLKACWIFKNWPYDKGLPPQRTSRGDNRCLFEM